MYETLTRDERRTLARKMDDAYDDITKLIKWAMHSRNGVHTDDLTDMMGMRSEILYAAWETPPPYAPAHEFHGNGTDPGNCCYCHTFHTTPKLADGSDVATLG